MYPAPFNYHRPENLQAAIALLSKFGDDASIMAGGQSLIPMLKMRIGDMAELVDIGHLPGLNHIEQRGDTLHIGALATHADIAASETASVIPLLAECGGGIADRQVRNMGTIGGGVSVADPSGDWPTGLRAVDARLVLTGPGGARTVSISDFILDSYTTCLNDAELVTEIQIALPPAGSSSAYVAFKRAAPAYPTPRRASRSPSMEIPVRQFASPWGPQHLSPWYPKKLKHNYSARRSTGNGWSRPPKR